LAFLFALLTLPLKTFVSISNQALRNQFKTQVFVKYNFFIAVANVFIAIVFLNFTNLGVASILLGSIIGDFLVLPLRFLAIKELFIRKINLNILKNILAYGIPFLPASIAYWIFSSADRVMLEYMSGLESVGIYTVALSLSSVMNLIASAVSQAWSPHAIKIYEEDKEKARFLYMQFLKIIITISLFLIFCAAMIGRELINFIFPAGYQKVFYPMLLLLTGVGFQITTQVTAIGISLAKKTIYFVYITLFIAIVNIGLNYILIPIYKEVGASFATMISYLLLTFIYAIVSQKLFRLNYDFKFIFVVFILLAVVFLFSFMDIIFRIVLLFSVFICLYLKKEKIIEALK
jgi:O-antigen/teichoic acid export membrane protein